MADTRVPSLVFPTETNLSRSNAFLMVDEFVRQTDDGESPVVVEMWRRD
jgi:hypothetical protein